MKYEGKPCASWDIFHYVHVKCRVYWYTCMHKTIQLYHCLAIIQKCLNLEVLLKGGTKETIY